MRTVQPGEVIAGKYVVQGIIGRGGVGIIAAARHVTLRQLVALKFLRPEIESDPEVLRRFVREAQATAQIRSEHVARVMDAGTLEDGTVFLVFEHLEGRDLARVLREDGPLAIADAVDYLTQACEAIAEAHALGIVHRDIKPANLFLTRAPDGTPFVKVLDFGLSKVSQSALTALTALTAENHVIGSPHFMSPEQMRSSRDADARSDIWALGVVLFGLLTGRVPFEGEFLTEVCAAILGGIPLSLLELRPEAPAELEAVILRCLRPKPEDRIQTVAELAQALHPFTPAHGRARAARIARVADEAKQMLASARAAPRANPAPLEQPIQVEETSEKPLVAEKTAAHGPSPVSWSISVEQAFVQHPLKETGAGAQHESPVGARLPTPRPVEPLAVASSPRGAGLGARLRRKPLLVATAAVSLLVGTAGTLWIARAVPGRSPVASLAANSAVTDPKLNQLAVSVRALRASAAPSQAPPAVSASAEGPRSVAPLSKPPAARPASTGVRSSANGTLRSPTQRKPVTPVPATTSKPERASRDEQLILGLPH
ncbi:MAG TPA: protein kinase [Polyangiaceae bacterium]|nr:protein kinase [Polyangiaceae bacterium]